MTRSRICPNPKVWAEIHKVMLEFTKKHDLPDKPPVPLILNGWVFSSDEEKQQRWQDFIDWATENGCLDLVEYLADEDFYYDS